MKASLGNPSPFCQSKGARKPAWEPGLAKEIEGDASRDFCKNTEEEQYMKKTLPCHFLSLNFEAQWGFDV